MNEIYKFSIRENIDKELTAKWLDYVTAKQRERLLRCRFREDFLRSLAGEALVRGIVGKKVNLRPEELRINRPEGGKPFFPQYPEIFFNISHSGEWVVCAISDKEAGIDIEEIKQDKIRLALIKKVLTINEQKYLRTLADCQQAAAFYRFWTMKEAYTKCVGRGLGIELTNIEINIDRQTAYLLDEGREWEGLIRNIAFCDNYILSICTVSTAEPGEIKKFVDESVIARGFSPEAIQ